MSYETSSVKKFFPWHWIAAFQDKRSIERSFVDRTSLLDTSDEWFSFFTTPEEKRAVLNIINNIIGS